MAGVWFCSVICTFWAVFASIVAIFPGFLVNGNILDNATLQSDYGVSRLKFESISLVAIGVTLIVGIIFYWLGKPTRDAMVTVPSRATRIWPADSPPRRATDSPTRRPLDPRFAGRSGGQNLLAA